MAIMSHDKDALRAGLEALVVVRRCGDGSCVWGHPGGMQTNGGCSYLKMNGPATRRELRKLAGELISLLADNQGAADK